MYVAKHQAEAHEQEKSATLKQGLKDVFGRVKRIFG